MSTFTSSLDPYLDKFAHRLGHHWDRASATFQTHLDRHWGWYIILASLIYLIPVLSMSMTLPVEHDEAFTYYIAGQPTVHDIWTALVNGADNQGPLDYCVRHFAMNLLGDNLVALRLPSVIGFLVALLCIFHVVRVRAGAAPAFVAFFLPCATYAYELSYQGRSYSLVLACCGVSLLSWQRATAARANRGLSLFGLGLSLAAATSLHYYSVLLPVPIALAELVRTWQRRKIDWPIWIAVCGAAAPLPFLLPLLRSAHLYSSHFWTPVTRAAIFVQELVLFRDAIVPLLLIGIGLILSARPLVAALRCSETSSPLGEIAAAIGLLMFPFFIYVMARVLTGAFWVRYFLPASLGAALLAGIVLRSHRLTTLLVLLVLTKQVTYPLRTNEGRPTVASVRLRPSTWPSGTPLVFGSNHDYVIQNFHAGAEERRRMFYLLDDAASVRLIGTDTPGRALGNLRRWAPVQVVRYEEFVAAHKSFLLFCSNDLSGDTWVLMKLVEDRAVLRLVEQREPNSLYEVSVAQ
jgi:hypothetical protein